MSFNQEKIDRATIQSRGIFNTYVYRTEDPIAEVEAAGYFAECRFAELDGPATNSNGWDGGIVEAYCDDGYVVGQIDASTGTFTALIPSSVPRGVLQLSITYPTPAASVAVTGTGETALPPPDGYVAVLEEYVQVFVAGETIVDSGDGRALVTRDSLLYISAYLDIFHSSNNATVGALFRIERGEDVIFSARAVHARLPNSGNIGNIAGVGVVSAMAGDLIGIALASSITGTVTIQTSSIVLQALT